MHSNPEFDRIVDQEFPTNAGPEYSDPTPYGIHPATVKTGLTPRGKAVIAVTAAVIAGVSIIGYNHYAAEQATADQKAQELAFKQQELRLKELQILGEQAAANKKTQTAQDTARQKQIDACVSADKNLIGKQMGVSYSSVLKDCTNQFPASADVSMQSAANATDTTSGSSGGGVNPFILVGGTAAAGFAVVGLRKGRRNTA